MTAIKSFPVILVNCLAVFSPCHECRKYIRVPVCSKHMARIARFWQHSLMANIFFIFCLFSGSKLAMVILANVGGKIEKKLTNVGITSHLNAFFLL